MKPPPRAHAAPTAPPAPAAPAPAAPSLGEILDDTARDELAVKNLDLVARVVARLPFAARGSLDRDDLLSAGTLGLLHASRTYQPMRGASFRTFAFLAIRAAVLDELRRHDPLPRGARARLKQLESLESRFRAETGRPPTPAEIGDSLALDDEHCSQLLALAEEERLLRSSGDLVEDLEDGGLHDQSTRDPLAEASRREELARIEAAIHALAPRERQVVVLYHAEGMFLKEIGEVLGVTESRVCQILACAQQKIRARVARGPQNAAPPRDRQRPEEA